MKGDTKIIEALNLALADELTAINQYMVHSEMTHNWGYDSLHELIEKRAIAEMKHAEALIARILFLEGLPIVSQLNALKIGKTVAEILANDLLAEEQAVKDYRNHIKLCLELGDSGTRELFENNLRDEEEHLDWLEAQRDQMEQMGLENYLARQ